MLSRFLDARLRVLLVGPPGCGKTARIASAATAAGRRLIVMRASLSERVDFGGALVPDCDRGITRALPLELLADLQSTSEPTLLFLDDLGQAPIDVQAALMRLFDDGSLSPEVLIWGATNRPGDKAGVSALCEPLRSRFHLAFGIPTPTSEDKPDVNCAGGRDKPRLTPVMLGDWPSELAGWTDWALDKGAAPEIVAWHRATTGRTLYQWMPHADPAVRMADFRSWETVIDLWSHGLRDLGTVAAAIGKPAAAEFLAFAALADRLPTPDQVRMDPAGAPVPSEPSALYLVATMLSCAAQPQDAGPFCRYLSRLPRVFGALLARDLFRRLGAKLSGQPEWVKWFAENQTLFAS